MSPSGWFWAAAGLVALVLLDRLVAWWPRSTRPRVRRPSSHGSGGTALGEVAALFSPSVRHLHEEVERQRHDVVLPGDADPAWDVDLDSATARRTPHEPPPPDVAPAPAPAPATAPAGSPPRGEMREVAPGILTVTSERWMSVTTVVVGRHGECLLVDPGVSPTDLRHLTEELARCGLRPTAGFSTHPHWDHLVWHAALGPGPRWATVEGAARAAATLPDLVRDADAEAPGHDHALTGRVTGLVDEGRLAWDGPEILVLPYPAHCRGSAALAVPGAGVLVAGDILSDVEVPLLDLEARDPVGDHLSTLDLLHAAVVRHGIEVIVPGHGRVATGAAVGGRFEADRRYLLALQAATQSAARPGEPRDRHQLDDDPRLSDDEVARQHHHQLAVLLRQGSSGGQTLTGEDP